MSDRMWDVVVIGAGGSQAQAMLEASARTGALDRWLGIDIMWRPEAEERAQRLGLATRTLDVLGDADSLREVLSNARLVANLAGPYYRTGVTVLNAAIDTRTDYLDICDDTDATLALLECQEAARAAGITALIGMGSSPGTSNVLIRAAHDYLGGAEEVNIFWSVDIADMTDAATTHFWHCFNLVGADGVTSPVPTWDDLDMREVDFPGSVGRQTLVRLAHPEPLTVPMFLGVGTATNYGTLTPFEATRVAWGLAYSVDPLRPALRDVQAATRAAVDVFGRYRETTSTYPRMGSGLIIDVHTGGNGIRFAAGGETEMAEATGVPAAAGIQVLLGGFAEGLGVAPPEMLRPTDFFDALGKVSRGGGGLQVFELVNGEVGERVRMRTLLGIHEEVVR